MLFRKCYLALLLLWPPVHLALSSRGHFSAWRFGGWGMYATPYPTPAQHPIAILLDLRERPVQREPPRRLQILNAGSDVSDWLEREAGLTFYVAGGDPGFARLDLGERNISRELKETCRAARQLNRERHLLELGRIVEGRLAQSATLHHRLYLSVGTRFADPLANRYGIQHEVFACCDRLEPVQHLSTPETEQ